MQTLTRHQKARRLVLFALLALLFLPGRAFAAVFDVADYGLPGDPSQDGAPALQAAIQAANASGGGKILFSRSMRIGSTVDVTVTGNDALVFEGQGSSVRVEISPGPGKIGLRLTNYNSVLFRDVVFTGSMNMATWDCWRALELRGIRQTVLENTHFYGILAHEAGSSVLAVPGNLIMRHCSFRGSCSTKAGLICQNGTYGLTLEDCDFLDYGYLSIPGAGLKEYNRLSIPTYSWVQIDSAADLFSLVPWAAHANQQTGIKVARCRFDEGAYIALFLSMRDPANTGRLLRVTVEDCNFNIGNTSACFGIWAQHTEQLTIRNLWMGYRNQPPQRPGIKLVNVGSTTLDGVFLRPFIDRVEADAACRIIRTRDVQADLSGVASGVTVTPY